MTLVGEVAGISTGFCFGGRPGRRGEPVTVDFTGLFAFTSLDFGSTKMSLYLLKSIIFTYKRISL